MAALPRVLVVLVAALGVLAAACGGGGDQPTRTGPTSSTSVPSTAVVPRPAPGPAGQAGSAVTAFGDQLFAAAAAQARAGDDVIVSPLSVAIALALLEPGAVGPARDQLRSLLHIQDAGAFHASLAALQHDLEDRRPDPVSDPAETPGELHLGVADAAYLQRGYPFRPSYLDAITKGYGSVLHQVDYRKDPDAVAHEIDAFVADATHGKIPKLIDDGVLSQDDVLTLVNALYFKASWRQPFDESSTERHHRFTRLDGSTVDVALMRGNAEGSAKGDGWVAASVPYVGGLALQVVLPDQGRFGEVAAHLPVAFAALADRDTGGVRLGLPRFTLRHHQELDPALKALGLTAPYATGSLLGVAGDPRLVLSQVIHETYVAMDEQGTEAAAATAAVVMAVSAPVEPPAPVILDRPFLFRIVDLRTGATLFEGRVMDPTG
jgi:serpin B